MSEAVPNSLADKSGEIRVRPAELSDVPGIADVHAVAFLGSFLADMGHSFLVAYYRAVLGYGHGILLVAEGSKGIEGFVGGFPAVVGLRQHIWRRKWRFIVPVCVAVLRHPRLWKRIVQRCYDVMSTRKQVVTSTTKEARQKSMNEYELSPVAVNPKFAGRGRGQLLVREFIRAASSLGAESVYLNTDAEDNERVNVFYRKLGFELKRTFVMDGQRPMNEYAISTRFGGCGNKSEST